MWQQSLNTMQELPLVFKWGWRESYAPLWITKPEAAKIVIVVKAVQLQKMVHGKLI